MNASIIVFYLLAAITLSGAIAAVTSVKLLRSAAYLLFSLTGIAGLYFWMSAPLIAVTQLLLYAGVVSAVIIFCVFLTHGPSAEMKDPIKVKALFTGLGCLGAYSVIYYIIQRTNFSPVPGSPLEQQLKTIGTDNSVGGAGDYLPACTAIIILMLAATMACVTIAAKTRTAK